jgi:hypothetical protein
MGRKIIVSESQINAVIKKIITEQSLNEVKEDVYKREWTKEDTILTLYCAKYVKDYRDIRKLGFENLGELANRIIGSTETSLKRQMGNILFLMGVDNNQSDVSHLQEKVYEEYGKIPEEELRVKCRNIIENTDDSNYEKFLHRQKELKGVQMKKEMELKKQKSQIDLDTFWRLSGRNPSSMTSLGHHPSDGRSSRVAESETI